MAYTSKQTARETQAMEEATAKQTAPAFTDQRTSTGVQLQQQQLMNTTQAKFVTAQRAGVEEEEPLQGKFETAQRAEEEELLQGKFETAQRAEEEELLQGKFETAQLIEEEEPIQGKFETLQRAGAEEKKANHTGMPDNLKSGIENLSGYSMDDVKVHYNSDKPAQLNAHAYAQGTDIHVAPGQEQHLPHEAWHVVQQKQGRVQPTMQMKAGVPVNDDAGLENEADVMGAKALQMQTLVKKDLKPLNVSTSSFQRKILVGNNYIKHYDDNLVDQQEILVKPFINQWNQMETIFDAGGASKTRAAKEKYLSETLKNDIRALLRKYNEVKAFADDKDLSRQLVQDIKLNLLGMDSIVGTNHADGQFSQVADDKSVGRDGKAKNLRIYRTMPYKAWSAYTASNDLKDILWGHGGSLGQALDYFLKSKAAKLDDVLVEFEFTSTAQTLVDYTEIKKGGEGGAPKGGKFTGKNEQNDILALDKEIFSINLGKSKDFIAGLNPKVSLKDQALSVHP